MRTIKRAFFALLLGRWCREIWQVFQQLKTMPFTRSILPKFRHQYTHILLLVTAVLAVSGCRHNDREDKVTGQAILGPLIGASVFVYQLPLSDAGPIYTTITADSDDLDESGTFSIPKELLEENSLYLLKIINGVDVDSDDDGVRDADVVVNNGSLHAVVTGMQLSNGGFHVSVLTEFAYLRAYYLVAANYSTAAIVQELDRIALALLIADIDGDGLIDHRDLTAWHPVRHLGLSKVDFMMMLQSVSSSIRAGETPRQSAFDLIEADTTITNPAIVGSVALPVVSQHLGVGADSRAYVGADRDLYVVDVATPERPTLRGSATVANVRIEGLAASSGRVFVASGLQGLLVVDTLDPDNPVLLSSRYRDLVTDVAVADRLVYLTNWSELGSSQWIGRLDIFDGSVGPPLPLLGSAEDLGRSAAYSVAVSDGWAYLTSGSNLRVIDVTDPTRPAEIGLMPISLWSSHKAVAAQDEKAYLGVKGTGLVVVDASTPEAPVVAATHATPGEAYALDVRDGIAYVADGQPGLFIFDVSESSQPELLGILELTGSAAVDVKVQGEFVYVLGRSDDESSLFITRVISSRLP